MGKIKNSYDEIEYTSKSFSGTLPYRQSMIMQLLGFKTPELSNARVLEIGCSFGGNILSFAMANENSECIGIDLSSVQISKGKKLIEKLGVKNLKLLEMDITNFDESLGKFDYIICHGVYSWVSNFVQDSILKVIKNHLNENGTAVVSYNTYPGWKDLDVLKDIMNFRVDYLKVSNSKKVSYGKGAIEFLKESPYIKERAKRVDDILSKDAYYLFHEYFENYNIPVYLYNFVKKLKEYDLIHISDTSYSKSFPILPDDIENKINNESDGDNIIREQYYDYYLNTQFRTSIITHSNNRNKINISRKIKKVDIDKLNFRISEEDSENSSEVYKMLLDAYPNTLNSKEILEVLNDENRVYTELLGYMYSNKVDIYTKKIKLEKKINEVIKIKDVYMNLVKYHLEEEFPLITFFTFDGRVIQIDNISLMVMLLFNGENTDEDICKIIENYEKEGKINIISENKKKEIKAFVMNIKRFIINNLYFE